MALIDRPERARQLELDVLARERVRERVLQQQPLVGVVLHPTQIPGPSGQLDRVEVRDEAPARSPVLDPPDVLCSHGVRLTYMGSLFPSSPY